MARLTLLALGAACAAASAPLSAQCRLCTQPTITAEEGSKDADIQLRIEANLSFDRLILSSGANGAATLRPDGSSGAEGAVLQVGPRAMVGTVLVHGDAGRAVRVDLPRRIELFSVSGGRMTLDDVTSDVGSNPRLDAAGNLSFRIGGRLIVTGSADGQFRGDLPVSVEYQ